MNLSLDEGKLGSDTDSSVKCLHLDLSWSRVREDDLFDREALFVCCDEGGGVDRGSVAESESTGVKSAVSSC